jgi:porin
MMRLGAFLVLGFAGVLHLMAANGAVAQEAGDAGTQTALKPAPATQPAPMPSILETVPTYGGGLWDREYLTGDWGGPRQFLADHGVLFQLDLTQTLQGNAHGGKSTNDAFRYSGSVDYYLKLDTARMGLWPGGLFTFHGETEIGDNINPKVGSLLAPNYQGLLPVPNDPGATTLSEFYITQALSKQ